MAFTETVAEEKVLYEVTLGNDEGQESDDFVEALKAIRDHFDAADRDGRTIRVIVMQA
jgi:hypothetical protein